MGKKARLKANQKSKKADVQKLKEHTNFLRHTNMYDGCNFAEDMPPNPSYSLMHSLKDRFSIVMYSGTYRLNLRPDMCMHKYNAVRIILPEWMAIIRHESLFYTGVKFRNGPQHDMRLFSYVWSHIPGNSRNRSKRSTDGVAREIGNQVYRDNITNKICKDFYRKDPECLN